LASACEVFVPTVHCGNCGLAQFLKQGRTKCLRCHHELEIIKEPPEEPEEPEILYPFEEYVQRLENGVCFALQRLRKKAHIQQKEVAERGHFGAKSYISKVENPLGRNRTIPTIHSLQKLAVALNVQVWQIVAMAEKEAGKAERGEWLTWWSEMVPLLKRVRRKDRDAVLAVAHGLSAKKRIASAA